MFHLTISDEDLDKLATAIAAKVTDGLSLQADSQDEAKPTKKVVETETDEAEAEAKAIAKKKRADALAKKKADEAAAEAAEAEAEETAPDGPSKEDVRKALKDFGAIEGRDAAIAILTKHDASSMGELLEENYQSVIDDCEA